MTDNKLMVLPDVQSSADRRNIPIRRVGGKGIRTPILVKSQSGAQHTVADVEMYVSLPADKKGTHMSRFWTLLGGINKPFAPQMMVEVMQEMLASLKSDGGYIRLAFPFFMEKSAPVSHLQSTMDYDVVLTAECADGKITVTQEVIAPVTSLCPCSKEISKYGAHNQRLLKRSDEKYVTEHAYENPKFVEDLVRDVAIRCQDEPAILAFTVEAENFESIHNHSAFASLHFDKRQTAE